MVSPPALENQLPALRERVVAGAKFLDDGRSVIAHWRNYIDLGRLDIGSSKRDVLAYLSTRFEDLGLTLDQAIAFGFEAEWDEPECHAPLTAAWKAYLAETTTKAA